MRSARHRWLATLAAVVACSSDDDSRRCASVDDASVCVEHAEGAVTVTAQGLRPGSNVTVANSLTGSAEVPVNADGTFDGEVAVMSATGSFHGEISVDAITADGATLAGTLVLE